MKKIDLTKEYPHLDATYTDYPVSSDVYAVFEQSRLDEQAQAKRCKRNGRYNITGYAPQCGAVCSHTRSLNRRKDHESHPKQSSPSGSTVYSPCTGKATLFVLLFRYDIGRNCSYGRCQQGGNP